MIDLKRPWLLPGLLALLLTGLLAASAVIWWDGRDRLDDGAVAVAREEATNFFSLDYRHAADDVDKVIGLATSAFKEEYSAKRQQVIDGVTGKKLVVTASIPDNGSAVEYLSGDNAQVLVAVDVTTTTRNGGAEDSRYRTRIELTKVGGSWLVSGVDQVG